jgi:hypothetical protein
MSRKRWLTRLSSYTVPVINTQDRNAVALPDLVRAVLVDFAELAGLSSETHEQLVVNLMDAIGYARTGVKAGKRGVSDKALVQQIFLSDVARALERAGLPVKRWRKQYDSGGDESFYFRFAREIARIADIDLPKDLKLPGKRAARHQYGVMSPGMVAAQAAEAERSLPETP